MKKFSPLIIAFVIGLLAGFLLAKPIYSASLFNSSPAGTANSAETTAKPTTQATAKPATKTESPKKENEGVPEAALKVAAQVEDNDWKPLDGYKNATFQNREKLLPQNVEYREHDIYPYKEGVNRGAERLVYARDGSAVYYTGDHYESFTKIER